MNKEQEIMKNNTNPIREFYMYFIIKEGRNLLDWIITDYTSKEGDKWASYTIEEASNEKLRIHSLRFKNGLEWDVINGLRNFLPDELERV